MISATVINVIDCRVSVKKGPIKQLTWIQHLIHFFLNIKPEYKYDYSLILRVNDLKSVEPNFKLLCNGANTWLVTGIGHGEKLLYLRGIQSLSESEFVIPTRMVILYKSYSEGMVKTI